VRRLRLTLGALAFAATSGALGHGAVQAQIDAATAAIASQPRNAQLYLRRGELHRVHEDWDAALADFDRAAALAPGDDAVDFLRGRALEQAGRAAQARTTLDRYLARHPDHADALLARARALRALGEYQAAVADFTRALELMARPDPDVVVERARVELARGQPDRALAGLDAAVARLGPVASLESLAIEVESQHGRVDAALARLDRVALQSPRKEIWLARRGDILADAGRFAEARASYSAALLAIETLPLATRRTAAMVGLEARVRGALATP
jgi:tetratricopeptide (TPR) repeat protein